jgi:hypothetical protein
MKYVCVIEFVNTRMSSTDHHTAQSLVTKWSKLSFGTNFYESCIEYLDLIKLYKVSRKTPSKTLW